MTDEQRRELEGVIFDCLLLWQRRSAKLYEGSRAAGLRFLMDMANGKEPFANTQYTAIRLLKEDPDLWNRVLRFSLRFRQPPQPKLTITTV